MRKNIDGADYQYQTNGKNELIVTLEGIYMGKVTSLPVLNNNDLEKVLYDYIDMRECLVDANISHADLTKLYERYNGYDIKPINSALIVFYNSEILAVLVDVPDLEFIEKGNRAKLIFHYFTVNEFRPYCIDYKEFLVCVNDINY